MTRLLALILLTSPLFAITIHVQKNDVLISENANEITLRKDDKKEIAKGTTLCYLSGKGKVKIPELKRQLKKPGQCIMIPVEEGTVQNYMKSVKEMATVAYWDSTENVRHGVGTKGDAEFSEGGNIIVKKEQSELLIYAKEFGPLPVIAILKDKNGKEIRTFENEESAITLFRINKKLLSSGMKLEVYNGFEELLINKNIVVE